MENMSPERMQKIKEVINRRQDDLTVIMDNVHKPRNMAAIARTCDAVGIPRLHVVGNYLRYSFMNAKAASGCKKWVETVSHKTVSNAYSHLKEQGYQILAAHFSHKALPFREIDYTRPTAIVVGAELHGISQEAADLADEHIIIPMMGMTQSLNVSVATSLILFEAQRQREEKGFYNREPNPDQTYPLEWVYPSVVKHYNKRNLPLPRVNGDGDILDIQ